MLPDISIKTRLSDALEDLMTGNRLWNQYARTAMRAELIKHHNTRIPLHFQPGAHSKYHYAVRKESTKKKKQDYWKRDPNLDLVRSDRSEKSVKSSWDITMRGNFGAAGSGGTLQGRLNMQMPDLKRGRAKYGGITPEEICNEIAAVTPEEVQAIGEGYVYRLASQINAYAGPLRYMRGTRFMDSKTGKMRAGASRFTKQGKTIGPAPGGIFKSGAHGPGF